MSTQTRPTVAQLLARIDALERKLADAQAPKSAPAPKAPRTPREPKPKTAPEPFVAYVHAGDLFVGVPALPREEGDPALDIADAHRTNAAAALKATKHASACVWLDAQGVAHEFKSGTGKRHVRTVDGHAYAVVRIGRPADEAQASAMASIVANAWGLLK